MHGNKNSFISSAIEDSRLCAAASLMALNHLGRKFRSALILTGVVLFEAVMSISRWNETEFRSSVHAHLKASLTYTEKKRRV